MEIRAIIWQPYYKSGTLSHQQLSSIQFQVQSAVNQGANGQTRKSQGTFLAMQAACGFCSLHALVCCGLHGLHNLLLVLNFLGKSRGQNPRKIQSFKIQSSMKLIICTSGKCQVQLQIRNYYGMSLLQAC